MSARWFLSILCFVSGCGGKSTAVEEAPDAGGDADSDSDTSTDDCDRDGDLSRAIECGGDDCDDADSAVHPGATEDEGWELEVLDPDDRSGQYVSIGSDDAGVVHVIYAHTPPGGLGIGDIRHVTNATGSWTIETAASDVPLQGNWCAVEGDGTVHVAYYASTAVDDHIDYATNDGGKWRSERVGPAPGMGWEGAIALDPKGAPRIAYHDPEADEIRIASRTDTGWEIDSIDPGTTFNLYASLGIDSDGASHLAFYDAESWDLEYASDASGAWSFETIAQEGMTGQFPSLVLDDAGAVHIAYYGIDDLRYATNASGEWALSQIDDLVAIEPTDIGRTSMTRGPDGSLHLAYRDAENTDLRYAVQRDGGWTHELVDGQGDPARSAAITMTIDGTVWIAYSEGEPRILHLAHTASPANGIDEDCDGMAR